MTEGIEAVYTGAMPLADRVHRMLLSDLYTSFFTAALLVATVMILVLRSVGAGFLAMIPNVFPMLLLFGTMGWLGFPVDIGSMMTASIALGIAVDDTIHVMWVFQRERSAGATSELAARSAIDSVAGAIATTTITAFTGFLVLLASEFAPLQSFGLIAGLALVVAFAADAALLPVLLAGMGDARVAAVAAVDEPAVTPARVAEGG